MLKPFVGIRKNTVLISVTSKSGETHSDCLSGIKCIDLDVCFALLIITVRVLNRQLAVLGRQVGVRIMEVNLLINLV